MSKPATLTKITSRRALQDWAFIAALGTLPRWRPQCHGTGGGNDHDRDLYVTVERFWLLDRHRYAVWRPLAIRIIADAFREKVENA